MTIEEFDNVGWNEGSEVIYKGNTLCVGSVDFEEKLIGVYDVNNDNSPSCDCDKFYWVRCENVELITKNIGK